MSPPPILDECNSAARQCEWLLIDNPGFSGAKIWRGSLNGIPQFAIKRWPDQHGNKALMGMHNAMLLARNAGLSFVPRIFEFNNQKTVIRHDNANWDIAEWMPGKADFHSNSKIERLIDACEALKQLHYSWSSESAMRFQFITQGQSINVAYRILMLSNPLFYSLKNTINDPTWRSVTDHIERARVPVLRRLEAWQKPMPLQWCIRDIWHDHILFDGDRVTGIIDYGTVRIDTPATDVARMLGDLVGDRRDLWELGASQFPDYPRDLILALDLAGTLGSAIHWLRQWSEHGSLPTRGMERLMRILRRLEVMKVG